MTRRQVYILLKITRSVLLLNLIVGVLRAIGPLSYAWTLVLIYLSFVLIAIECLFEPAIKFAWIRALLVAATLACALWFTIVVPFSKAPYQFAAYIRPDESVSDKLGGIEWNKHFTDLRLAITNPTNRDYRDVDISIKPDTWIYKASILDPTSGCELSTIGGTKFSVARAHEAGKVTITARPLGNAEDTYDSSGNQYVDLATDSGYRLRCLKFPSNYTIRIVLAAVNPPNQPSVVQPSEGASMKGFVISNSQNEELFDILGPKPIPSKVTIMGTYTAGIKPFSIEEQIRVESH